MTDFIAIPPSLTEPPPKTRPMHCSGPDTPSWPDVDTGPFYHGYLFRQDEEAQTWVIAHGLNTYPDITVQTQQGQQDSAVARWVDLNHVEIIWAAPTSGMASLIKETNAAGASESSPVGAP